MNRFNILITLLLLTISSFSQFENGKIEYEIEYELIKELESQRSSLPKKMIVYLKKDKSRKEEITRIGSQVLINNNTNKTSYLLMQIADESLAINVHEDSDSNYIDEKITYINEEIKEIAGYNCNKAILNSYNSNSEEANTIELFYTKEIKGVFDLKFKNLKGFPLKYTVKSKGMTITYSASILSLENQDYNLFEIPKGFTVLSMSEFKRLMSN